LCNNGKVLCRDLVSTRQDAGTFDEKLADNIREIVMHQPVHRFGVYSAGRDFEIARNLACAANDISLTSGAFASRRARKGTSVDPMRNIAVLVAVRSS
jgi:hypothetical protein